MTRPGSEVAANACQPCRKGRIRGRISALDEAYWEIPASGDDWLWGFKVTSDFENSFRVDKTVSRNGPRGDYNVSLNPVVKEKLGLGGFAVVVHQIREHGISLSVPCRVSIDETLPDDKVLMDHSLRFSIGVPFFDYEGKSVSIHPLILTFPQRLRYTLSGLLGRRYIIFRVCKPLINDIESQLCRIPSGTFPLLGCDEGDNLVLESVVEGADKSFRLRSMKLQAFAVADEIIMKRKALEEPTMEARFRSAEGLLGVTPDIERVFLDRLDRNDLGLEPIQTVRAGRALGNQFAKNLIEFGIVALATLFAVIPLMMYGVVRSLPWVIGALVVAIVLVIWRIRASTK